MTVPLFIVGCGGFGREVYSLIQAINADSHRWSVAGFVDDAPTSAAKAAVDDLGSALLGDTAGLMVRNAPFAAVVAIGDPATRAEICHRLRPTQVSYPVLVHPDATVGRRVQLAEGAVIAAGARLSTAIDVGPHVHIDQNATVGHDTTIGSFTRLNPQACISGAVTLDELVLVGAGATILQGRRVGKGAVVGAAACVVHDVPPGAAAKGVPARW